MMMGTCKWDAVTCMDYDHTSKEWESLVYTHGFLVHTHNHAMCAVSVARRRPVSHVCVIVVQASAAADVALRLSIPPATFAASKPELNDRTRRLYFDDL